MAFKKVEISDGVNYIRPKALADSGTKGVILEGEFLGTVENPMSKNSDFKFSTADGITVINRSGTLAKRMELINPGTLCQVVYNGQAEISTGAYKGTLAHQFEVLVEDGE